MVTGSRQVWVEEKHLRDRKGRFAKRAGDRTPFSDLPRKEFHGKHFRKIDLLKPKPGTEKRVSHFVWDKNSKKLIKMHPKENLSVQFKRLGLPGATEKDFGEYQSLTNREKKVYKLKPGAPEWGYSPTRPDSPVPNPRWFISPYSSDKKGVLFESQYKKQIKNIATLSPGLRRYLKGGHWASDTTGKAFDFVNRKHKPPLAIEIRGFKAGSGYGSGDQPGHRIGNRGYGYRKEAWLREKELQGTKYKPIKLALIFKTAPERNPNGTFKIEKLVYAASRPGIGQWHVKQLNEVLYDKPKEMI